MADVKPANESLDDDFLPTIKCSTCGEQVGLDQLADHVCGQALSPPLPPNEATPQPDSPIKLPGFEFLTIPTKPQRKK
ncbi:hypothetical protein IWQ62_005977, partial [Dispira parvispora]